MTLVHLLTGVCKSYIHYLWPCILFRVFMYCYEGAHPPYPHFAYLGHPAFGGVSQVCSDISRLHALFNQAVQGLPFNCLQTPSFGDPQ